MIEVYLICITICVFLVLCESQAYVIHPALPSVLMVFSLIVFKLLFSRGQGRDEFNLNVWSIICEYRQYNTGKLEIHTNLCFLWMRLSCTFKLG